MSIHSENPFNSRLQKYYLTPELSQRVNLICHLIQNSEQLLLILAESGYGKTALLNQLQKIAETQHEHWWTYKHTSTPAISPETFASKILTAFNVRHDGKPMQALQDSLRNHIAATRYNGQLPVLFIDDAHKLPLATLKFVIELAMQGEPLTRMRVVLFCEPQISSILATPEFEIVHDTLVHNLDIPALSKTQVRDYLQFYIKNSGYRNTHPFTSEVIKKIYKESEGVPGEINQNAGQILHQFGEQHLTQTSLSYSKLLWGLPIVIVLIIIAGFIYLEYPNLFDKQSAPVVVADIKTNENLSEHAEANEPVVVPTITTTDAVEATLPTPEVVQPLSIKNETWLKKQNSKHYTLQVLGAYDKTVLHKFSEQHKLDNIAMYKTYFQGKSWYVLLYGNYPSYSQATTALAKLPEPLRKSTKPWIRTFGSIKKRLK
ncbi:AAA family ATPase [Candidatus Halobeggiatoa sp. HSG11]|nr:AAA family ATPase [Candidatus Halobeggiatoa sp. HSG11]